jgi:hypothetical protein
MRIILAILFCSTFFRCFGQIDKITYPANGSIFQQDAAGNYNFSFGGTTRKESGLPDRSMFPAKGGQSLSTIWLIG